MENKIRRGVRVHKKLIQNGLIQKSHKNYKHRSDWRRLNSTAEW
jgi:hypothetical protein